jgi:hypothetical protein
MAAKSIVQLSTKRSALEPRVSKKGDDALPSGRVIASAGRPGEKREGGAR